MLKKLEASLLLPSTHCYTPEVQRLQQRVCPQHLGYFSSSTKAHVVGAERGMVESKLTSAW